MSKVYVGDFHTNFSSPMRCFSSWFMARPKKAKSQRTKNQSFYIFGKRPQGSWGSPTGPQGVPWSIYCTKTKPQAPGIELSGSRRPILAREHEKKQKPLRIKVRPSFLKLRNRFSTMLLRPSFLIYSFLITGEGGVVIADTIRVPFVYK